MKQWLAAVTLVVRDYDEAIAWYRDALGFVLLEDTPMGDGKRWVRVAPRGADADGRGGATFLFARAVGDRQQAAIGHQAGGRVGFFLHTDDFDGDYAAMTAAGVRFAGTPRDEPYGRVVVFEDLYGNRWDFIGPAIDGAPA